MDILDDMGVSKLSAIFFSKVNYSFKQFSLICHHSLLSTVINHYYIQITEQNLDILQNITVNIIQLIILRDVECLNLIF